MTAVVFEYNNKALFDNSELGYGVEDAETVRQHYAQFNKEMLQATYTVIKGDPIKVVFAKKTGTKGGRVRVNVYCPRCFYVKLREQDGELRCVACGHGQPLPVDILLRKAGAPVLPGLEDDDDDYREAA